MTEDGAGRLPYFSIGHSTLTVDELAARLRAVGVTLLIDVRSIPRSRTNLQFNREVLPGALAARGLRYLALADLGGRRGRQRSVDPECNALWRNTGFHNYADWALQPAFRAALQQLRELGQRERCAVMCAESLWWRCHRRIIADHLLAAGERVFHIMENGVVEAQLTEGAQVQVDGAVSYPPMQPKLI